MVVIYTSNLNKRKETWPLVWMVRVIVVLLDEGVYNLKGTLILFLQVLNMVTPLLRNDVQVSFLLGGWPIETTFILLITHFYNSPGQQNSYQEETEWLSS
jgi:hypothetical protein